MHMRPDACQSEHTLRKITKLLVSSRSSVYWTQVLEAASRSISSCMSASAFALRALSWMKPTPAFKCFDTWPRSCVLLLLLSSRMLEGQSQGPSMLHGQTPCGSILQVSLQTSGLAPNIALSAKRRTQDSTAEAVVVMRVVLVVVVVVAAEASPHQRAPSVAVHIACAIG